MTRTTTCLLLTLPLLTAACGDANGRPMGSSEAGGLTTFGDETGMGDETGQDSMDENGDDNGDDQGETGLKFDIGAIPDGAPECEGDVFEQDFSYIWIANSTQGTVSKIDTVSTIEEGRFSVTHDASMQPSRTSVNQFGDVAVGHRFSPKVTKVAPVAERCVDKNLNGVIDTSGGADDIRPFMEDECVLWSVDLPAHANGTRAVAWEGGVLDPSTCENTKPNPRLWVAYGNNPLQVYRLDGDTGQTLDHVQINSAGAVYGGAVNAEGDFWVSDRGGRTLSRVDADTLETQTYNVPGSMAYGMGMDENGHPWFATYEHGAGDQVYRFDPDLQTFVAAGGGAGRYRGMNVDREGRAWVAGNAPCRLSQFDTLTESLVNDAIELPGCSDPVGVSVDRDGYVWVVDRGASVAWKVDPEFHQVVGTVTGLVNPYTYSDMTGQGLNLVVNPPG